MIKSLAAVARYASVRMLLHLVVGWHDSAELTSISSWLRNLCGCMTLQKSDLLAMQVVCEEQQVNSWRVELLIKAVRRAARKQICAL